ncbi:hypothetical protein C8R32_108118 [Nitrosospira sp. Nsp5]|uniref:Nucleoside 2-deoxyribosyltransferase n=1 Tax=Nitrosospira multiformis TaxID=1231 RepID=A0ABY0T6P0_9PROT|nr:MULTISPECIES: hypothetical protein [Nitrosospira]PTR07161.1 hypothetical protein C8R32_108118 [Nitrosospira sp. Nsp5]SDQ34808.1 hypothetical protein SAMN05216402_0496 [Nitrosospira multiformis]
MTTNASVVRFANAAIKLFDENRMVVFLCGPALKQDSAGARLRKRLKDALEEQKFEVVLGEDDGLEETRLNVLKGYAHSNELDFINKECGAIVLVADSVGSFCELGLFAHEHTLRNPNKCDFILFVADKYKPDRSYINEGPVKAIEDYGLVEYVNFDTASISHVIKRLERRRSLYFLDGRGRPAKS